MGAWSHEPFGNDTAADWAYGLDANKDLSYIEAAIDAVFTDGADYLDASLAEEAIAAVEVLAKLLGKGTQIDAYTESADIWVATQSLVPSPDLRAKAVRALDRIAAGESELAELWGEGGESDAWEASVQQLRTAMSG